MSNVLILIALSLGLIAPVPARAGDYLQGLFASCQKSQTDIYSRLAANSDKEIQQIMPMFTNLIQKVEIEEKALKNKSLCSKKNRIDQFRLYAYLAKLETVKARIEAAVTEKATYSTLLKQMKDVPLDKFYVRVNGTVSNGNKPYLNLDEPKLKNDIKARIEETFKNQPKPPGLMTKYLPRLLKA